MKRIFTLFIITFCTSITFSQTVIFEDNFDSYILNQGIASQTNLWTTWTGVTGGTEDAVASDLYAFSPLHSMQIINDRDMAYEFGNISSGHYSIEFNALFHQQGYFSVQHNEGSNWAFEILVNYSNQILYKDAYYINQADTVGTYVTDQWINFKFEIDLDLDSVFFYIDNVFVHSSNFSNSINSTPSSNLDVINFYGLSGLNGVANSDYYIDDFSVLDLSETASISNHTKKELTIFPNPAKEVVTINAVDNLKNIIIYDMSGQIVYQETLSGTNYQFSLTSFSKGIYSVKIVTETTTVIEKLVVN